MSHVLLPATLLTLKTLAYVGNASRIDVEEPQGLTCIQVFSRNEEDAISHTLESVRNQYVVKAYPSKFRLQVFDSSTDRTPEIARSYGFEVVELPRGKLYARNYSVINYPNCWVHVHLDADTVIPPNWLGNVLSHFRDLEVVAVTTPRVYTEPPIATVAMTLWRGVLGMNDRVYGSNCAVRHDAFMNTLFDLSYDGRSDMVIEEEYNFYRRLSRLGKVVFEDTPAFTRVVTRKYIR